MDDAYSLDYENKMVIDALWHDHAVILLAGEEQEDEQEEEE
ncbi:MAG: hypothetical protein VB062_04760 [Christensenella sp.]|nr:hypothetical protein [Christensenella sp.]